MSFAIPLLGAAVRAARDFKSAVETEGGGLDGSVGWNQFYNNFGAGIANSLASTTPAKAILERAGGLEGAVNIQMAVEAAEAHAASDAATDATVVAEARAAEAAYT